MKTGYLVSMLLLTHFSLAQVTTRTITVVSGQPMRLAGTEPISSVAFTLFGGQAIAGTYLIAGGDTLTLRPDPHPNGSQLTTVLCVFRKPVHQFTLYPGPEVEGVVGMTTLNVPPLPPGYVQARMQANARGTASCDKPTVVPVAIWRTGLAPPKEKPVATQVRFVIVHHSAGSNTATNYTEEVRNIYTFHTQSNGWNDVGYNFLIGRDGVIFEGRDGQGILDGDNVLGAHFCSQNSNTMGICLMGNYNDIQPTDASLTALNQLIGWKLKKEGLQPVGVALHVGSAKQLNSISGHRDGCATECPGTNLYAKLPGIRAEVGNVCSFTSVADSTPLAVDPAAGPMGSSWLVFPNPAQGTLFVDHPTIDPTQVRFELLDGLGRHWTLNSVRQSDGRWQLTLPGTGTGLFWLRCTDGPVTVTRPVWYAPN